MVLSWCRRRLVCGVVAVRCLRRMGWSRCRCCLLGALCGVSEVVLRWLFVVVVVGWLSFGHISVVVLRSGGCSCVFVMSPISSVAFVAASVVFCFRAQW